MPISNDKSCFGDHSKEPEIYLWIDNDEAGLTALAQNRQTPAKEVKVIDTEYKDANENVSCLKEKKWIRGSRRNDSTAPCIKRNGSTKAMDAAFTEIPDRHRSSSWQNRIEMLDNERVECSTAD